MTSENTYATAAEARESLRKRASNGNARFPFFRQAHPTAGDERDFFELLRTQLGPGPAGDAEGWGRLCLTYAVLARQAKGIAVVIRGNRVAAFVPFSHAAYSNTWGCTLAPRGAPMLEFLRGAADPLYPFDAGRAEAEPSLWRGNGHLVRHEHPASHSDSGVPAVRWFLDRLCGARVVPDCAFFVNRRDFPQLRLDGAEPHEDLSGAGGAAAVPRGADLAPLLSMVSHAAYADLAIPTWDDMSRGCFEAEGRYLPKCRSDCGDPFVAWDAKAHARAVFRGASTGRGVTVHTNPRLRAAHLAATDPAFAEACDAGITHFSTRLRRLEGSAVLARPQTAAELGLAAAGFLDAGQQALFKYILHLPGHSAAYRLATELATGSVLLVVEAPYRLWFQGSLVAGEHYLAVREDLADLVETVRWCRAHDAECRAMAARARAFYEANLRLDGMLDHTLAVLRGIAAPLHPPPLGRSVGGEQALRRRLSAVCEGFAARAQGTRTLADLAQSPSVPCAVLVRHATAVLVALARARSALGFEHGNMGPGRVMVLDDGGILIHDLRGARLLGVPGGLPDDPYRGDLVACPAAHPSCDTLASVATLCAMALSREVAAADVGVLVDFAWRICERTTAALGSADSAADRERSLRVLCLRLCPWIPAWSRRMACQADPRCLAYAAFPPVELLPRAKSLPHPRGVLIEAVEKKS